MRMVYDGEPDVSLPKVMEGSEHSITSGYITVRVDGKTRVYQNIDHFLMSWRVPRCAKPIHGGSAQTSLE